MNPLIIFAIVVVVVLSVFKGLSLLILFGSFLCGFICAKMTNKKPPSTE